MGSADSRSILGNNRSKLLTKAVRYSLLRAVTNKKIPLGLSKTAQKMNTQPEGFWRPLLQSPGKLPEIGRYVATFLVISKS